MPAVTNEKLKELLVNPGYISEADFNSALKEAVEKKVLLERILVEEGLIEDKNLGKLIADSLNYRFIDLSNSRITEDLLAVIPEVAAKSELAVAFGTAYAEDTVSKQRISVLKVATSRPENKSFFDLLEKKTGYRVDVYYATSLGMENALRLYEKDLKEEAERLIEKLKTGPEGGEENIINLVNLFLERAHDNRASDIHIEPLSESISVRFRVDGVLREVAEYPVEIHERVVFRIKIMARLRTDEHGAAQDGRFEYKKNGTEFDVRVSILPVTDGENVVMRLLSDESRGLTLELLGLTKENLKKIKLASKKPYGMILASGPTGSGKTTTLYAVLQTLNKPEVNIMTIEDPIEYDVERVQQTQVNPAKKLTFATGLRSIVRQDPDIIMVGEIRDEETASIAVNAAMTGHLLLSTLHANNAATAFPRLIEMGIEPFLVTSSVNVVIAQRLVRKICEHCKQSYFLKDTEIATLQGEKEILQYIKEIGGNEDITKIRFYRGEGCKSCGDSGYSGRTGIFEVMELLPETRSLIAEKSPSDIIESKAQELGMLSMTYDAVKKIFSGTTTIEEVIRATKL